jgi:hypothetical protein
MVVINLIIKDTVHTITVTRRVYRALHKIIYRVHILNDKAWANGSYQLECENGKIYKFKGKDIGTSL